jgi:chondroitin 4-sulfotransferase 11
MISHKHKFIFIHCNRTGGTSIERKFRHKRFDHRAAVIYIHTSPFEWHEYFKFTAVRNSWDRMVSMYSYSYKAGVPPRPAQVTNDTIESHRQNFTNWLSRLDVWVFTNQWELITIEDKVVVDRVLRFERLAEDFAEVCDILGIKNKQLPHINSSKHHHYSEYYIPETKELVAKICKKEIDYFGFRYEENQTAKMKML